MSWEDILKKEEVDIKIDPRDEESDYDGHEHEWKFVKIESTSDYSGGDEYAYKLYRCKICGVETSIPYKEEEKEEDKNYKPSSADKDYAQGYGNLGD